MEGLVKLHAMDNTKCAICYDETTYSTNNHHIISRTSEATIIDTIIIPSHIDIPDYTLRILTNGNTLWNIPLSLAFSVSTVTKTKQGEYIIQLNNNLFSRLPHNMVLPLVCLGYTSVTIGIISSNQQSVNYKIIYKNFVYDAETRRDMMITPHDIPINSYREINIPSNTLLFTHKIPISGVYLKTNHRLHGVTIKYTDCVLLRCNSIIINRHLIKKTKHWSTDHGLAVEDTLKELGVVKGVRGIIQSYCTPKHHKEYFYWLPYNYDNNGDTESVPLTRHRLHDAEINFVTNNNKVINGTVYLKQHNQFIVVGGLGAARYGDDTQI